MSSQNNLVQTNRIDFLAADGSISKSLYISNGVLSIDGAAIDTSGIAPTDITLAENLILVGQNTGFAGPVALSGEATIVASGAITLANSAVIGKVLTGYVSGAGTVAATDTLLQAVNKLNGNAAAISVVANAALPSASFTDAAVTSKLLTGFVAAAGAVAATDTILQGFNKLVGNAALNIAPTLYTPTGSFTNTTYQGVYSVTNGMMTLEVLLVCSGTPGAANLTVNLPGAYTINTSRLVTMPGAEPAWLPGRAYILDSGTGNYISILAAVESTTALKFYIGSGTAITGQISNTSPITFVVNDLFWATITFPVTP